MAVLEQFNWPAIFAESLTYEDFLKKHGTEAHQQRWANMEPRVQLTAEQRELVGGFVREMNVFCLSGAWCGDCVNQVPILKRIAEASPKVTLRLLDREANPALRDALVMNGGARVPAVVFLSEDWQVCGVAGDRVVAYYRQMAKDRLGPACPTGIVPPGEALIAEAVQEWVTEFERIQLMLRLTGRLREKHGD
jgi:hypothetical protein